MRRKDSLNDTKDDDALHASPADGPVQSRREFIKTSATLGATLALGGAAVDSARAAVGPPAAFGTDAEPDSPRTTLSRDDVERAVRFAIENISVEGLDDVFPRPFEVEDLATDASLRQAAFDLAVERLAGMHFSRTEFEPVEIIAFPKPTSHDLRRCSLLDPMDSIVYLTLAILAAPTIEQARPPMKAGIVLSHRVRLSDGRLYEPGLDHEHFVRVTKDRLAHPESRLLVALDIQRFYERVDHAWLDTCLTQLGVDRALTRYLRSLLDFWSEGRGQGLPVGPSASRILAEAVLTPVDWKLIDAGIRFTRFVDDYRLFAPDTATAESWRNRLVDELALQGLSPNLTKTGIYEADRLLALGDGAAATEATPTKPIPTQPTPGKGSPTPGKKVAPRPSAHPLGGSGYRGQAPKEPDANELVRLRALDLPTLLARLGADSVPTATRGRDFIMAALYRNESAFIRAIPDVVSHHPRFAPYAVAALRMRAAHVSAGVRLDVSRRFARRLLDTHDLQTFEALQIVRLLGCDAYSGATTLATYLRGLDPATHAYLSRAILDSLAGLNARIDPRQVLSLRATARSWTRRGLQRWSGIGGGLEPLLLTGDSSGRRDPFLERLSLRSSTGIA